MLGFRQRQNLNHGKRRKLPRDGDIVAVLDIGAAKSVCFIARVTPVADGSVDADIIGAGHYGARPQTQHHDKNYMAAQEQGAPLRQSGSLAAREKAVRAAVEAAETLAGERISEVHICVPGHALQSRHVGVDLDIAGGFVTGDDIADSLSEGAGLLTPEGAVCLHALPTGYMIDGDDVGTDPRGLRGSVLTTRMLGIHASENTLANLESVVENAGLCVASWVAAPLACARSVLVDDEKELGVLVIDFGAHGISYTVYHDGRPTGCGGISPGAGYVTRDIAQCFSTPIAHAERQKILHGTLLNSAGDEHRFVDMLPIVAGDAKTRVSRADLTSVITPRIEEIYENLIQKIINDGANLSDLRRVVITGGGSQLEGLREHAERIFAMKARLGRPLDIAGAPEALTGPAFSVSAGAIQEVSDRYGYHVDFPETENLQQSGGMHAVGGMAGWLKAKF